MGPKIQAAIDFVQNSALAGRKNAWAAIGDLRDAAKIISNEEGTMIRNDESLHTAGTGVTWRQRDTSNETNNMSIQPPKQSQGPHKSG
jgi:carbamate kinase